MENFQDFQLLLKLTFIHNSLIYIIASSIDYLPFCDTEHGINSWGPLGISFIKISTR